MKLPSLRSITSAGVLSAALVILVYSATLARQDWRYWRSIQIRRSARHAVVNRSTILDRDRYASTLVGGEKSRAQEQDVNSITLFLVVADECEPCNQTIAKWSAALSGSGQNIAVEAAVPTGTRLESKIVGSLVTAFDAERLVVREISDLERFRHTTGIAITPTSLILEGTDSLIAVLSGVVSDAAVQHCRQLLAARPNHESMDVYTERGSRGLALVKPATPPLVR